MWGSWPHPVRGLTVPDQRGHRHVSSPLEGLPFLPFQSGTEQLMPMWHAVALFKHYLFHAWISESADAGVQAEPVDGTEDSRLQRDQPAHFTQAYMHAV